MDAFIKKSKLYVLSPSNNIITGKKDEHHKIQTLDLMISEFRILECPSTHSATVDCILYALKTRVLSNETLLGLITIAVL